MLKSAAKEMNTGSWVSHFLISDPKKTWLNLQHANVDEGLIKGYNPLSINQDLSVFDT